MKLKTPTITPTNKLLAKGIVADGNYYYVGLSGRTDGAGWGLKGEPQNSGIVRIDRTTGEEVVQVFPTTIGAPYDIVISNGFLYSNASVSTPTVVKIDLSLWGTPSAIVGTVTFAVSHGNGVGLGLDEVNNRLYVTTFNGFFHCIDLSTFTDTGTPLNLASATGSVSFYFCVLDVANQLGYVGTGDDTGKCFKISLGTAPSYVTSITITSHLRFVPSVIFNGNLYGLTDYTTANTSVVKISLSSFTVTDVVSSQGGGFMLFSTLNQINASGTEAHFIIAPFTGSVAPIEFLLSNSSPKKLGKTSIPTGLTMSGITTASDGTVVIGANKFMTPNSTISTTSVTTTPRNVEVLNKNAFIISGTNPAIIQVWDISNPVSPSQVGSDFTVTGSNFIRMTTIDSNTNRLYAVDSTAKKLFIIDISDPANLSILGSFTFANAVGSILVDGYTAFVGEVSSGVVRIMDVTTPSSISQLTTITTTTSTTSTIGLGVMSIMQIAGEKFLLVPSNGTDTYIDEDDNTYDAPTGFVDVWKVNTPSSPVHKTYGSTGELASSNVSATGFKIDGFNWMICANGSNNNVYSFYWNVQTQPAGMNSPNAYTLPAGSYYGFEQSTYQGYVTDYTNGYIRRISGQDMGTTTLNGSYSLGGSTVPQYFKIHNGNAVIACQGTNQMKIVPLVPSYIYELTRNRLSYGIIKTTGIKKLTI